MPRERGPNSDQRLDGLRRVIASIAVVIGVVVATALGLANVRTNAEASGSVLEEVGRPDASGLALLRDAADAMRLSARGYHRMLKVAVTLADLDVAEKVGRVHLAEALSCRTLADQIRRAA
jgi:magnesium chelatase family protein